MEENLTQIKTGIAINVEVSAKIRENVMSVGKKYFQSEYKYL